MNKKISILLAAIFVSLSFVVLRAEVNAHEGRDVADYKFVVGFREEPAYEGMLNAVSLVVTRVEDTHEAHEMASMPREEDGKAAHDDELMVHGALFISPSLKRNETFEFEISHELTGETITYHVHPGDFQGVITVSDDASDASTETVLIGEDGMMPAKATVKPGDTLTWENHTNFAAVLMSGPVSSMTGSNGDDAQHGDVADMDMDHITHTSSVSNLALQVEITHIPTASAKTLTLMEVPEDPGHYTAEFVPTATGDYSFRIFGDVNGTTIDELFESGPGTFDTVIAADAIQFPNVLESRREVENAARGALDAAREADASASDASDTANLALVIAIFGVIVGIGGIGIGIFGISVARRSR